MEADFLQEKEMKVKMNEKHRVMKSTVSQICQQCVFLSHNIVMKLLC